MAVAFTFMLILFVPHCFLLLLVVRNIVNFITRSSFLFSRDFWYVKYPVLCSLPSKDAIKFVHVILELVNSTSLLIHEC